MTKTKTKTKFTTHENGSVTVAYDNPFDEGVRIERTFFCPLDGGYVREDGGRQVCRGLAGTGPTLVAESREGLPALIRREYRRMKAEEKKILSILNF